MKRTFIWLAAATVLAGACSSGTERSSDAASTAAPAGSAVPAGPSGPSYSTRFFRVPFDVVVPSYLDPMPADDAANFVTFGSADGAVAVRVLHPVVIYPPDSDGTKPVPADYVAYLLSLSDHGATLTDREDTTVDGRTTTVFTGSTANSLDGSIGCPGTGISADECFGLQPEFSLRMAVVATDSGPLLIWLRSAAEAAADVAAQHERLDQLLAGVHFVKRSVESRPVTAAVDTEFDGVYRWTITKEDALAHGTPSDQTPEGLTAFPNTFTTTLKNGRIHIVESSTSDVEDDPFEASSGHLFLGDHTNGLSAAVTRDPDGTLHLTAIPPILDPGAVFVLTTEPWVPVK